MIEAMAICKCSGLRETAVAAFNISFPEQSLPKIYRGEGEIQKLADTFPDTNFSRYLKAIAKKNGRYAYYLKADDEYNITMNYDLLKGKRIA